MVPQLARKNVYYALVAGGNRRSGKIAALHAGGRVFGQADVKQSLWMCCLDLSNQMLMVRKPKKVYIHSRLPVLMT